MPCNRIERPRFGSPASPPYVACVSPPPPDCWTPSWGVAGYAPGASFFPSAIDSDDGRVVVLEGVEVSDPDFVLQHS